MTGWMERIHQDKIDGVCEAIMNDQERYYGRSSAEAQRAHLVPLRKLKWLIFMKAFDVSKKLASGKEVLATNCMALGIDYIKVAVKKEEASSL